MGYQRYSQALGRRDRLDRLTSAVSQALSNKCTLLSELPRNCCKYLYFNTVFYNFSVMTTTCAKRAGATTSVERRRRELGRGRLPK
jgi:hypothetical protein